MASALNNMGTDPYKCLKKPSSKEREKVGWVKIATQVDHVEVSCLSTTPARRSGSEPKRSVAVTTLIKKHNQDHSTMTANTSVTTRR